MQTGKEIPMENYLGVWYVLFVCICFICVYLFSCLIGCCSYSGEMGKITEWGWQIYLKQTEQEHGPQLRAGEEETRAQSSARNKEGRNKGQRWGPGRERQSREGRGEQTLPPEGPVVFNPLAKNEKKTSHV